MCRALAAARKGSRCVEPSELERIADTVRHGGIVAVVEDTRPPAPTPGDAAIWCGRNENLVILDRIGNAHNLGAMCARPSSSAFQGSSFPGTRLPRVRAQRLTASKRQNRHGRDLLDPGYACFPSNAMESQLDIVDTATRGGSAGAQRVRPAGPGPWCWKRGIRQLPILTPPSAALPPRTGQRYVKYPPGRNHTYT